MIISEKQSKDQLEFMGHGSAVYKLSITTVTCAIRTAPEYLCIASSLRFQTF